MSVSANQTALDDMAVLRTARIGTRFVANYLAPRKFYYSFSNVDDYMALQLLVIDQARLLCQQAVTSLRSDASVWRGRVKQVASNLYRERTYHPLPLCNAIDAAIISNMTEDEIMMFGTMASYIDEAIKDDLNHLAASVFSAVSHDVSPRLQQPLSAVLSCHLFCLVALNILQRCIQLQGGSHYYLCRHPDDADERNRAYLLSPSDIDTMQSKTRLLMAELSRGHCFGVEYTPEIEDAISTICNNICDIVTIYKAACEAGIDINKTSGKDLKAAVARIEANRAEKH